jgi:hypothetical protein
LTAASKWKKASAGGKSGAGGRQPVAVAIDAADGGRRDVSQLGLEGGEIAGGDLDAAVAGVFGERDALVGRAAGIVGVVVVGVVAGDAQQHGWHAEREGDLAGGGVLGLDEVHVLRRERHRLPVEPALQQQRAAGVAGALEALLQLALEALVLLGREVAVT